MVVTEDDNGRSTAASSVKRAKGKDHIGNKELKSSGRKATIDFSNHLFEEDDGNSGKVGPRQGDLLAENDDQVPQVELQQSQRQNQKQQQQHRRQNYGEEMLILATDANLLQLTA